MVVIFKPSTETAQLNNIVAELQGNINELVVSNVGTNKTLLDLKENLALLMQQQQQQQQQLQLTMQQQEIMFQQLSTMIRRPSSASIATSSLSSVESSAQLNEIQE